MLFVPKNSPNCLIKNPVQIRPKNSPGSHNSLSNFKQPPLGSPSRLSRDVFDAIAAQTSGISIPCYHLMCVTGLANTDRPDHLKFKASDEARCQRVGRRCGGLLIGFMQCYIWYFVINWSYIHPWSRALHEKVQELEENAGLNEFSTNFACQAFKDLFCVCFFVIFGHVLGSNFEARTTIFLSFLCRLLIKHIIRVPRDTAALPQSKSS